MGIPLHTEQRGNSIVQTILRDDGKLEERENKSLGKLVSINRVAAPAGWTASMNTTRRIPEGPGVGMPPLSVTVEGFLPEDDPMADTP